MAATYLMARDGTVSPVPRGMARLISAYERATARAFMITLVHETLWFEIPPPDGPLPWLLRRTAFALAREPRGDDDPALDMPVPGSGWPGNFLAMGAWGATLGGLVMLLPAVFQA